MKRGGGSYRKRVTSAALSVCMAVSFIPVGAFAEVRDGIESSAAETDTQAQASVESSERPSVSDDVASFSASESVGGNLVADQFAYQLNSDNTCTVTGYQGNESSLDIPSSLSNHTVASIAAGAFKGKGLNAVTIPESVVSVGAGAFDGCDLSQVFLTSWDTYDIFASSEAGYFCGNNTLYFVSPKSGGIFNPGDDTGFGIAAKSQVDIKSAWCKITLSNGETVKAEMIKNDRGQWRLIVDASWVDNGNCEVNGFVYADASGNETTILTTGFFGAYDLAWSDNGDGTCTVTGAVGRSADLAIPAELGGLKVAAIGENAFKGASWIESLSLPAGLKSVGSYAFKDCTSLKTAELPEGLASLGQNAFEGCASLESASVPGSVGALPYAAFSQCSSLKSVSLGEGISSLGGFSLWWCTSLESIELPSTLESVGERALASCSALALVELPSSVGSVGEGAFLGLAEGSVVKVPTWELYYQIEGSNTYLSPGRTSVECYSADPEPAMSLAWSDNGDGTCTVTGAVGRSADLAIPAELGGLKVAAIGENAFKGASWIESLSLPAGLKSVGSYAFKDCTSLKTAELPEGLASLGQNAFEGCASLESASVPGSVGALPYAAFSQCSSLKSVSLGEGISSLGGFSLWWCTSLESIELPSTLESVGERALASCSALALVELPSSVGSVGEGAFLGLAEGSVVKVPTWELYYQIEGSNTYLSPERTSVSYDGPATVYGESLTLEGAIGVNLYVALPDSVRNLDGAYALVGADGRQAKVPLAEAKRATAKADLEGVPMYVFTTGVYAKNMSDQLAFSVYDGDGNRLPLVNRKGAAVDGDSFQYSVKAYCEAAQKAEGSVGSAELTELVKRTADYGAAAQVFFGYETGDLAGDPASDEAAAVAAADLDPYKGSVGGSAAGLDVVGYSLTLEEATTLSFYFSPQLGHSIDEYSFEVDGAEAEPAWTGQRWKVTVANIPAQNLEDFHTVTATRKSTGQSATVRACALSYASSVLRSKPGSNLEALCQALYLYNRAANAFFDAGK